MPAMVEAGAISGLLRHLASSTEGPPPSSQQAEVDQQSPSLLLAARLLYAFSLDPGVRCVQQFSRLRSVVWVFKPLVQHSFHLPRSARGFPLFYCCERTYGGIFSRRLYMCRLYHVHTYNTWRRFHHTESQGGQDATGKVVNVCKLGLRRSAMMMVPRRAKAWTPSFLTLLAQN